MRSATDHGDGMETRLSKLRQFLLRVVVDYPWIGWAGWLLFCAVALLHTNERRIGSTFTAYFKAALRLRDHLQIYDPTSLGDFLYLPIALLIITPLTHLDVVTVAAITLFVYAVIFTLGCTALALRLFPVGASGLKPMSIAGLLLLINIPAAWFNFKGVQSQIIMTGAMMLAAAAIVDARWLWASFWLFVAIVFKPLALVMALLCGALWSPTRLPLAIVIVLAFILPFAFFDGHYLVLQYQSYAIKLWAIATAPPGEWPYQADISTLLRALHIELPAIVITGIRIASALVTLWLAWRATNSAGGRGSALAVLLLSGCYITLFGPRNEYLSFVVLTPAVTALAFVLHARDESDPRAWLLMAAALVLGFVWHLEVDVWLKPAIVLVIYFWLGGLLAHPRRWRELVGDGAPPGAAAGKP